MTLIRESRSEKVLLTGATGYVGGRLLRRLESERTDLRCLARRPEHLIKKVGRTTEVVRGDVLDPESLGSAMENVHTAYYLVHALGVKEGFESEEVRAAETFARAAAISGVKRIIYLGGLGRGEDLSPHLKSRQDVGRLLRESGVPTLEFQASIVIGSGSLSFEMIRALVNKLPVMITPRWVSALCQPIAIEDVIDYLTAALRIEIEGSEVFEIGGPDQIPYAEMIREYASQRGLRRWIIRVPVLTPRLSSLWLGLVTPVYARVGRKLIDSLRNDTIVRNDLARRVFDIRPRSVREAISRALVNEDQEFAQTRWSDALSSSGSSRSWGGVRFGSRLVDSRRVSVPVPVEKAFRAVQQIGGETGWYYGNWLWELRGFLDLLFGGAGLRRGRRDPVHVAPGDTIDFWRVEAIEENRLMRLSAEMRLPGRAWLQFEVDGNSTGSVIRQTAIFDPVGILGLGYWYALYPAHRLVFAGMLKGIAEASCQAKD